MLGVITYRDQIYRHLSKIGSYYTTGELATLLV